jgi:Tol biopolymer transport system component
MLTGRRVFAGEDVAETIGAIIHKEPAWEALPADTPAHVTKMLRRCLQKDPRKRLPHIGVARIDLDEAASDTSAGASHGELSTSRPLSTGTRLVLGTVALLALATVVFAAFAYSSRDTVDTPIVTRTSIVPPANIVLPGGTPGLRYLVSPDGRKLAFLARDTADDRFSLWVRPLDALTWQRLSETDGVVIATWSPDSRSLAFVADGRLRRIDESGGPAITLADRAENTALAWSSDDVILFSPNRASLFRVPASGGAQTQVTKLDDAVGETGHWHPFFLPDNRHFLYAAVGTAAAPGDVRGLYVGSLDPAEQPRLLLDGGGSNPKYASGHVLFMRGQTLMAQSFNLETLALAGEAVPLAEQIQVGGSTGENGGFSVSQTGMLVYQTGAEEQRSQLTWFDRAGKRLTTVGEPADQMSVALSPDGTRVVVSLSDATRRGRDLWVYDLQRGLRTRFTFDPASEVTGTWTPDGARILFHSRRSGRFDLYQKASSGIGDEELVFADNRDKDLATWSPDGKVIVYQSIPATGSENSTSDLWILSLAPERKSAAFLQTPFSESRAAFSPDGRWLAYASNESGRFEVFVTPFPSQSGKWQVSTGGGTWPRWRRDGKELFYLTRNNTLMAAAVDSAGDALQVGHVQPLFDMDPRMTTVEGVGGYWYDVSADGQRFLVNVLVEETSVAPITLLVNWPSILKR